MGWDRFTRLLRRAVLEGSGDLVTRPIARSKAGILVDAMFHLNLFSC